MNSWAQLSILDCLWSGSSTKSKDKMMNHRGESDSRKESTRKGCTEQEWDVLQSKLIPPLHVVPVCWNGGGGTDISLVKQLFRNHIFSPARLAAVPRNLNLPSFRLPTHPHIVDPRDSSSSCSWEWHWGKHSFRGPEQTLPALLITLTKGGQLWCSLTSNYEAHCGLLTELCRH